VIGWLDCAAGASGDMLLGAVVDAGAPLPTLQAALDALQLGQVCYAEQSVTRAGLSARKVDVVLPDAPPVRRTWRDLRALLEDAELADPVRATALATFARLARAEGAVHALAAEDVHFHEVGALDAVADVVGVAAGWHALGVEHLTVGPVTLGGGTVRAEHGVLPVPGPAVLALLTEAGAPVQGGPVAVEMCTPTGAALLATLAAAWGPLPAMTPRASGIGAGGRDLPQLPNVARLVLGTPAAASQPGPGGAGLPDPGGAGLPDASEAILLEANVDDLDPRLWPGVLAALLSAGAADAWLTPILMKKGRPAHTLHVLADPATAPALARVVFAETSTIGLRTAAVSKVALPRQTAAVDVDGQRVRVKLARLDGRVVNASVEYDDAAAAAAALARPAAVVLAQALAAARDAGLAPE